MKKTILFLMLVIPLLAISNGKELKRSLPIDIIPSDISIPLQSVDLTFGNEYGDETASKTIDGNYGTHYSSNHTAKGDSITLDYTIKDTPKRLDIIKLIQRTDQNGGSIFDKGSIWYKSKSKSDWTFASEINVKAGRDALVKVNIKNPTHIRVCLQSRVGHAVSLAELELLEVVDKGDLSGDLKYFEDDSYSKLKASTKAKHIKRISNPLLHIIAQDLLTNSYENEFRGRSYKSQRTPWIVSKELKIGSQSHYDNPTGIFFKEGKKQYVFMGSGAGAPVSLVIRDFRENGGTERITLTEGVNSFTPKTSGSGYIQYYTDGKTELPNVNIHFAYGDEVGFWDIKNGDSQEDYEKLLSMAEKCYARLDHTNGFISVCGENAQLINTVSAFKEQCDDIVRLIAIHDKILGIEYSMMGLVENGAVPANRKLNLRTWGGPPHWNGSSANYPNAEDYMLNADVLLRSLWVFGHELGHGNQIRPHMSMTGWGETSNNVYSMSVMYKLGGQYRMETEVISRKQGDSLPAVAGDRFNAYLNEAFIEKELYLTHEGPDYKKGSAHKDGLRGDHYVKLVPLWQLTLFFEIAGEGNDWGKENFWGPINWRAINDNRTNLSNGERYINFMKSCIDSGETNLSDFFESMGLLVAQDRTIDDYSVGKIVITEAQVADVKAHGAKYPKPTAFINYISGYSVDAYKGRKAVQGSFNEGVTPETLVVWGRSGDGLRIDHNIWKNVTAFETYCGDELFDISMVGSGSTDNSSTYVRYPKGSTRLEAVSYDGKRTLVYGVR